MIPDGDGELFRAFTNGWVPWSVLVGPDGKVVFSENEFDESGLLGRDPADVRAPRGDEGDDAASRSRCRLHGCIWVAARAGWWPRASYGSGFRADHRVVLVDRAADHRVSSRRCCGRWSGERRLSQFSGRSTGCEGRASSSTTRKSEPLDLDNRSVVTAAGDLDYDSLVVSFGAQLAPETVEGFDELAFNLYSSEGCDRIHAALRDFTEGVVGILIPALPFKCPAAPYEAAFLTESYLRKKGIRRNVEIHLFTPEHTPMPVAPAALGDSIADMLAARGIHYHPLFTFQDATARDTRDRRLRRPLAPGRPPDLCPAPPRSRGHPLVAASRGVGLRPRRSETLQTDYDDVYAIGDVATIKLPNGKALPKAGVFAHAEAKIVAQRIADAADGKKPDTVFDRARLLLDRAGRRQSRFRRGQLLRRTRTPDQAPPTRQTAPLGQDGLREVVATPLVLGKAPLVGPCRMLSRRSRERCRLVPIGSSSRCTHVPSPVALDHWQTIPRPGPTTRARLMGVPPPCPGGGWSRKAG